MIIHQSDVLDVHMVNKGYLILGRNQNPSPLNSQFSSSNTHQLLPRLLNGLVVSIHLLREEAGEPRVLAYLIIDKGNGLLTRDLNGWLSLLSTTEPRLRPTPVTLRIEIDRGDTTHVITLHIYLEAGQRVCQQPVG